ncbi:hypothetical protein [Raineyella fluvialis]|uniref:Uncharacterized protein n=1 Tax=Raineyella fluvialis TaxID=2662261 RepID=A0A5Q2F833_9ACTN|nr:hypothetical protein [Raineyella fluvialis]QGF23130.1 hypothetical protein Rai3103_05020 [Raineyella fluvialis]
MDELVEPEHSRCQAVTRSGRRCKRPGDPFCYQHRQPGDQAADSKSQQTRQSEIPASRASMALAGLDTTATVANLFNTSKLMQGALAGFDTTATMANLFNTSKLMQGALAGFDTTATVANLFNTSKLMQGALAGFDTTATMANLFNTSKLMQGALAGFDTTATVANLFNTSKLMQGALAGFDTTTIMKDAFAALSKTVGGTDSSAPGGSRVAGLEDATWDRLLADGSFPEDLVPGDLAEEAGLTAPPLEIAAAASLAAASRSSNAKDALNEDERTAAVMLTALVVLAFWAVYLLSPQLRAAYTFIEFPVSIAPWVWQRVVASGPD